jgi:hypothetical protein
LSDIFSPKGFKPKITFLALHCNPVRKTVNTAGEKKTFPITNAAAHLTCFKIAVPKNLSTPDISVVNQFGSGTLVHPHNCRRQAQGDIGGAITDLDG